MKRNFLFSWFFILLLAVAGCSDSDSPSSTAVSSSISGTAATGAAMTGNVTAVGANGATITVPITNGGAFTLPSGTLTFPALVKADDGAGKRLYSWALAANQTANITPLTTLALILTPLADNLDTLFTSWSASAAQLTSAVAAAAQAAVNANLQTQLTAKGVDYKSYDFHATPFTTNGSGIDGVLDGLNFSFNYAGGSLPALAAITQKGTNSAVPLDANIDISQIIIGGPPPVTPPTPPVITSFAPTSGASGTTVTITGSGFDPDPFHMQVSFADNVSAAIVSSSATTLVVTVPTGAVTGAIKVTNGLTSQSVTSGSSFTVTTSGGGNPTDWTQRNYGSSFMLDGVAYGNGTFVAVGFNNTIVTSADGITWTKRTLPDSYSYSLKAAHWDGSQFIITGDVIYGSPAGVAPLIATSPDGVTWTRRPWTNSYETMLVGITSGGGQTTVVGMNGIIVVSANGTTWATQQAPSIIASINGVGTSGTIRVAVGRDSSYKGVIIRSTDGSSWTTAQSGLTAFYPKDVAWNGSKFVAVGAASANMGAQPVIMSSVDGSAWAAETVPAAVATATGGFTLNRIIWTGSKFIAVGDDGASSKVRLILESADGVSWSVSKQWSTAGQQNSLKGVAASATVTVVVGDSLWTK